MNFRPLSDQDVDQVAPGWLAPSTAAANTWASKRFSVWAQERNRMNTNYKIPIDFATIDPSRYNWVLSHFVTEVTDENGKPYSSDSGYIRLALSCLASSGNIINTIRMGHGYHDTVCEIVEKT